LYWVGVGDGIREHEIGPKNTDFGGPKKCFRGRQVGAFSDFCGRHTGGPFIFRQKTLFFRKIDRFRGWCNI